MRPKERKVNAEPMLPPALPYPKRRVRGSRSEKRRMIGGFWVALVLSLSPSEARCRVPPATGAKDKAFTPAPSPPVRQATAQEAERRESGLQQQRVFGGSSGGLQIED